MDKRWHASCLQCYACRQPLDRESSCYSRDGNIYCKSDYYRWALLVILLWFFLFGFWKKPTSFYKISLCLYYNIHMWTVHFKHFTYRGRDPFVYGEQQYEYFLFWYDVIRVCFCFFQENTFQQIKQHQRGPEFWCYIETFIAAPGHTPPLFRLLSGFRGYTLCAEAVTRSQLKWRTAFQLQDTNLWTDGKLKLPQKQKINVCFASRVTDE